MTNYSIITIEQAASVLETQVTTTTTNIDGMLVTSLIDPATGTGGLLVQGWGERFLYIQ